MASSELIEEGTMLEQSRLLSEARLAIEHVRRLKRLAQHRPVGRRLQRRVRALEEAALRMELEARTQSVCRWRAQGTHRSRPSTTTGFFEAEYLDADLDRREVRLRPDLGQVKRIEGECLGVRVGHDLDEQRSALESVQVSKSAKLAGTQCKRPQMY